MKTAALEQFLAIHIHKMQNFGHTSSTETTWLSALHLTIRVVYSIVPKLQLSL